jgi:hypothetical protein
LGAGSAEEEGLDNDEEAEEQEEEVEKNEEVGLCLPSLVLLRL